MDQVTLRRFRHAAVCRSGLSGGIRRGFYETSSSRSSKDDGKLLHRAHARPGRPAHAASRHARCVDASGGFFQFFKDDGTVYDRRTRHLVSSTRFVFNHAMAWRRFGVPGYQGACAAASAKARPMQQPQGRLCVADSTGTKAAAPPMLGRQQPLLRPALQISFAAHRACADRPAWRRKAACRDNLDDSRRWSSISGAGDQPASTHGLKLRPTGRLFGPPRPESLTCTATPVRRLLAGVDARRRRAQSAALPLTLRSNRRLAASCASANDVTW